VIDEHGRVLVIQRRDNAHWEPPGGILERGETITEGLLREVEEETGLLVEPEALTATNLQGLDRRLRRRATAGDRGYVLLARGRAGKVTEVTSQNDFARLVLLERSWMCSKSQLSVAGFTEDWDYLSGKRRKGYRRSRE